MNLSFYDSLLPLKNSLTEFLCKVIYTNGL